MLVTKQRNARAPQQAPTRTTYLILGAALLVTAAILFLAIPALQGVASFSYNMDFVDGYDLIANNLAKGNGYRWTADMSQTMMREPGNPLFMAAIFRLFGYHIEAVRAANWLLTVGISLMLIRLTRKVTKDRRIGLTASLLFLFHPGTLIAEARGGVEILFICVACIFLLALYRAWEKGTMASYLVAGLAMGLVIQVRSTPILFPGLLLLYMLVLAKGMRERLTAIRNVALIGAGMAIVVTPWVIRNYNLVHQFVPVADLNGVALQEGQYACRNLTLSRDFYTLTRGAGQERGELAQKLGFRFEGAQYFQVFYNAHDEWEFNQLLLQKSKEVYIHNPGLVAQCVAKNLFNFWFLGRTWKVTELNMVIQLPMLILALAGINRLRRRGQLSQMAFMLMFVFSIMAVHLPIVAEARYSIPVLAFLAIPAGVSLMSIWQRFTMQAQRRAI